VPQDRTGGSEATFIPAGTGPPCSLWEALSAGRQGLLFLFIAGGLSGVPAGAHTAPGYDQC